MIEGIAISFDGWSREYADDEIAVHFLSDGLLPPLSEFIENHTALGEIAGGFYAASVNGFIRDTYGPEALRNLWINGCDDVSELLGADINQVETAWKNHLRIEVREEIKVDLETIKELGCG